MSAGKGNGNPLQYSCLGNPVDRGAWRATVYGVIKELDTTERLTTTIISACASVSLLLKPVTFEEGNENR